MRMRTLLKTTSSPHPILGTEKRPTLLPSAGARPAFAAEEPGARHIDDRACSAGAWLTNACTPAPQKHRDSPMEDFIVLKSLELSVIGRACARSEHESLWLMKNEPPEQVPFRISAGPQGFERIACFHRRPRLSHANEPYATHTHTLEGEQRMVPEKRRIADSCVLVSIRGEYSSSRNLYLLPSQLAIFLRDEIMLTTSKVRRVSLCLISALLV